MTNFILFTFRDEWDFSASSLSKVVSVFCLFVCYLFLIELYCFFKQLFDTYYKKKLADDFAK